MFLIPGWLISLLTFPGVILHEWAHKIFCDLFRVPVFRVCYFRFGNPSGYVVHAETESLKQTFWVSAGPLFVNTIATLIFGFMAGQTSHGLTTVILIWLALSAGVHAVPSNQDVHHLHKHATGIIGLLLFPLIGLVWVVNFGKFFWFDFFYACVLVSSVGGFNGY